MKPFISANNVTLNYGSHLIIDSINIEIEQGETVAVIGPSGCGKSTLMNIISGIKKHYKGEIFFQNENIDKAKYSCGYVPQNLGLLPWKSVKENIFIATKIDKNLQISEQESASIIENLGLTDQLSKYPSQLSGGQKQRVALARIFVSCPDILLLDEPFSALDTFTAETTRLLFLSLWRKRKITSIINTHNIVEATQLGKKIVIMSKLPGRILHTIQNPFFETQIPTTEEQQHQFSLSIKQILQEEREKGNF